MPKGELMDPIDRRDAIRIVDSIDTWQAGWRGNAIESLKALPSAQPEIVRCRECKYWREHKYAKETKRYIPFCGFNAIYTKADDYCSYAERRTDERTD